MTTLDALLVGAFLGQCLMLGFQVLARRETQRAETQRAVRAAFRRVALLERARPRGRNRELALADEIRMGTLNTLIFLQRIALKVTP